jgi:hypothetical protein
MLNKFISNDIKLVENISILYESRVILYGAGWNGYETYRLLNNVNISVAYFCDSNYEKQGDTVCKTKILSPEELKILDKNEKITIIVTPLSHAQVEQIINDLKALELRTDDIFTTQLLKIALLKNAKYLKVDETVRDMYIQKEKLGKFLCFNFWRIYFYDYLMRYPFDDIWKILIHQPGKVGSKTIHSSLSAIKISNYQTHYLNIDNFAEPEIREYFVALLMKFKKLQPLKIITLVREPLSRNYSAFFQLIGYEFLKFFMQPRKSLADLCVEWMEKYYDYHYLITGYNENQYKDNRLGYFNWFEKELKAGFGVDLLAYPFDREKGYSIIKQGNIEVLVMKMEKLSSLESVIGEFVGAPNFKLINSNEASDKVTYDLYKKTREIIKIPRRLVSRYYDNNPYMDHFYTEEEKTTFLKKWENNITD